MNKPNTVNAAAIELLECGERLAAVMWGILDVAESHGEMREHLSEVRSAQDDWNRTSQRMLEAIERQQHLYEEGECG